MARIEIEGLDELRRNIRKLEGGVDDLKAANSSAAKIVENAAAPLVPRRTGRLRMSLRSSGTQRAGVVRAGKASVPYAGPIHFGWRKRNIRPQPFIYEAADRRRSEVLEAYDKQVGDLIRKYDL